MFFSSHRAVRRARRAYELVHLRSLIEDNRRRLAELEAERNRPCPGCEAAARWRGRVSA